ncbi:hypothetical protein CYMTET_28329, partial [Cymbomonas tetramitiformis]
RAGIIGSDLSVSKAAAFYVECSDNPQAYAPKGKDAVQSLKDEVMNNSVMDLLEFNRAVARIAVEMYSKKKMFMQLGIEQLVDILLEKQININLGRICSKDSK